MLGDPRRRGVAIVGRRGVFVLGRQAIVNGHDDRVAELGQQLLAGAVVRFDVADDPPAAVEEDEHRQVVTFGGVDADRDVAGGAGHGAIEDDGRLGGAELHHREAFDHRAGFLGRLFGDVGAAGFRKLVKQHLCGGVNWHVRLNS